MQAYVLRPHQSMLLHGIWLPEYSVHGTAH